jgi:hypothetical protein
MSVGNDIVSLRSSESFPSAKPDGYCSRATPHPGPLPEGEEKETSTIIHRGDTAVNGSVAKDMQGKAGTLHSEEAMMYMTTVPSHY